MGCGELVFELGDAACEYVGFDVLGVEQCLHLGFVCREFMDSCGEVTGGNLVELPAEVEACVALKSVALGTKLVDLLAGQVEIDAEAGVAGWGVSRGGARLVLFLDGGSDVFAHAFGIGEPGRDAGRASVGGVCDLVAVVLQ